MDLYRRSVALYGRFSPGQRERLVREITQRGGTVVRDLTRRSDVLAVGGLAIVAIGIVCALVLGALFGCAHGLLITKGRIEPFIVTLGTLGIFRAVLTWLADGGALTLDNNLSDLYGPVYYASLLGVPVPIWVFLVVAAGGALILNRTAFGRHVQAIGSNEQVARYAAIRVDTVKIVTYVLLGICVCTYCHAMFPGIMDRNKDG